MRVTAHLRARFLPALVLSSLALSPVPALSDSLDEGVSELYSHDIPYGTLYQRYEPTFYTGFVPRGRDPERIHVHLGRGNQTRVTVVLSDDILRDYAADLLTRYNTYRDLIDRGEIVLTQNAAFEDFEATIWDLDVEGLVADEAGMSEEAIRTRNLALMERLNPGRVFRISMPIDEVVRRWAAHVDGADLKGMDRKRQIELVNLMLPTRLYVGELDAGVSEDLKALVALAGEAASLPEAEAVERLRPAFVGLFERVTKGHYPLAGDRLAFVEFTAIYPVGSFNQYTEYRGQRIPMYPTPGRRALTTHQRTKTPDHIPTVAAYSYSPWLPYMHVGKTLHNSFHTLWWRMQPAKASFLPTELRDGEARSREGKPYNYLWLLSRGPMSHGCTHVTTGHINELRQLLPAQTEQLFDVEVFLNRSYLFDVFDIDGDFEPEVMGVKYFVAYSLRNKAPNKLRAPTDRESFYAWLYGGALKYDAEGRGYFTGVMDAKFDGPTAVKGTEYERIELYEAEYEPERFQFYARKPISFVRELRKVGADHPFAGAS